MPKQSQFTPSERRAAFEAKFVKGSSCWDWVASKNQDGYGQFGTGGRTRTSAHRFSYQLYVGEIPDGLLVLHRCDRPCCVNPAHLFIGTQLENIADRHAKGRSDAARGERQHLSKLSVEQVRSIRLDQRLHREIAAEHGVSFNLIGMIKKRLIWKHVV